MVAPGRRVAGSWKPCKVSNCRKPTLDTFGVPTVCGLSWKFLRTPNSQITLPICAASQASVRHVFKCRNAKGFRFPLSRQKNSKGPLKDNHSAWLVSVCCLNGCWNIQVPQPRKHATPKGWKLFLRTHPFSAFSWKDHHITPRNVTPGTPSWQ